MPSHTELRDELQRLVIDDLLGPANGPDEIVDEVYVRDRYLVGRLAPRGTTALPEQMAEDARADVEDEDGTPEAPPPKAAVLISSSIGLTFAVEQEAQALRVTARWGRYERVTVEDERYQRADGKYHPVWRRVPMEGVSPPIPLRAGRIADWRPCEEDQPEVLVQGLVRARHGQWVVTLFLVNGQKEPERLRDTAWVFQPELVVEVDGGAPLFRRRLFRREGVEPEEKAMAMLYRHQTEFAVGHGIAVHADLAEGCTDRAVRLSTRVVPTYELPATILPTPEDTPALAGLTLDMAELSGVPDGCFEEHLTPLITAYSAWIEGLEARVADPDESLRPYAEDAAPDAVDRCRRTLVRLRAAIALLDADPRAAQAFRFANRAMHLQRVRTQFAQQARRGIAPDLAAIDVPANRSWRVFQLAFFLLNLPALADPTHPERSGDAQSLADLLWFPTGGGKTEAYLGVAAFAMGVRRLQGEVGGRSGHAGVTVLMRYTLRLLTLQQFQRATALICACEVIRREEPHVWGSEPFRIGLWVGRNSTPNWTKDAEMAIRSSRGTRGFGGGESTPHQLTDCPWCGCPLDPGKDIDVILPEHGAGRTILYCGDQQGSCPFGRRGSPGEGIPALVVDEEIYRRLPSLLIATVDKFAQMPWNGRTAMLFGQVDGYCERHGFRSPEIDDSSYHPASKTHGLPPARTIPMGPLRPPDLIIQDELHLISGPLGTLVGLYETAVDALAAFEVGDRWVRPKVIASTATIRRADTQVHNVFLREVNVFPPHGLDAGDNFYALQRPPTEEQPGRRYLGLCATGVHQRTAHIRAYVAFLAAAQKLFVKYGPDADPWMTLVGYFNSLRQLGGMRRAVDDTISARLRRAHEWGLARRFLSPLDVVELTSRLSATDIPKVLDRLQAPFEREGVTAKGRPKRAKKDDRRIWPIDVLLATNMISVGVDVSRLGLMVVAGQPKTTAEYIQATSRVGRLYPGIVATVYSWARPRDISHYEQFEHYHATFYQYVEALSVTPFAPRAIDRGLAAVLVALVRLAGLDLNDNLAAGRLRRDDPALQAALARILARAEGVTEERQGGGPLPSLLNAKVDHWLHRVAGQMGAAFGYRRDGRGTVAGLLSPPKPGRWDPFTCLNSLRDVEPSVNLLLDEDEVNVTFRKPWVMPVAPAAGEEGED